MSQLAVISNPESFIFPSNDDLRTTSLKVAEAFGKRHDDVLKKIRNLECSAEFHARNFAEMVVERVNPSGGQPIKSPAYEMTKNGFMFLVMGFTGKTAAQIKEAYITAFDMMREKLFPATQLLESSKISKSQYGELSAIISDIATSSGKEGTTKVALWSRFSTHFKISSSKDLPASKFEEAKSYLESKKSEYDRGFTLAVVKKDDLQTLGYDNETKMFAVRALPEPQPKTNWSGRGHASMILGVEGDQRLFIQERGDMTMITRLSPEDFVGTFETIVRELKMRGYLVVKQDDLVNQIATLAA